MKPRRSMAITAIAVPFLASSWGAQAQESDERIDTAPPARSVTMENRTSESRTPQPASPTSETAQRSTNVKDAASTDRSISFAVEQELAHDPLVELNNVDVGTRNGSVTLMGTVPHLLAKERAVHVAETVRGVTKVVDQMEVRPSVQINPEALEDAITQALLEDPATESFKVTVRAATDGEVTLTGRAASWAEKELVSRVAKGVRGVTGVSNNLDITRNERRLDKDVVVEVERLLRWDAYIDHGDIDVSASDGVVRLSGDVRSAAEMRRARTIAFMSGATEVNTDGLIVSNTKQQAPSAPRGEVSAKTLADAVQMVLEADPRLAPNDLTVTVEGNAAFLHGNVDTLAEKRAAARHASGIDGIQIVRNRLKVRSPDDIDDGEIVTRAVRALQLSPITEAHRITVSVIDGIVDLHGKVDTWYERGTADELIAKLPGVTRIDNHLEVSRETEPLAYDPYVDVWSIYEYDWYTPSQATIWKQDSVIAESIRDEFAWSPFVDGEDVKVSVDKGIATLTGEVDSIGAMQAATENALEGGAAGVVNKLELDPRS